MRLNRLMATGLVFAVSACLASAAMADSYVGYSGDKADDAYINGSQVTMTAGDARSQFLGSLSGYYYEDFQEVSSADASKKFSKLGISSYAFQWKSPTLNTASAPTGTLTTGDPSDTLFRLGPVSTARGAFDTYDPTLASATGGALSDSQNSYVDLTTGASDYDVTINIAPGMDAVGLMLNDVLQPKKLAVMVTFLNGTTIDATDDMQAYQLNSKGVLTATTLSNNNVWFLGITGTTAISQISIDEQSAGTPIALDNIYAGNVVPLPASVLGGGVLLAIGAIGRRRLFASNG